MIPTPKNHPLRRDGHSQPQRVPAALDPRSAPLDDRELADLLAESRDVAGLLRYYDLKLEPAGTWSPFFDRHAIVQLALVSRETAEIFQARTAAALADLASADPPTRESALRVLAAEIAAAAARITSTMRALATSPFGETLARALDPAVVSAVRAGVENLHQFLAADGPALLAPVATSTSEDVWGWSAADLRAPSPGPAPTFEIARDAAVAATRQLGRVRGFISRAAATGLVEGLFDDGRQPAHLGLFVTWLRQFRHGQNAVNDIVRRHLEYYLRDIAGFRPRPAQPDHAYLVFELAKGVNSHLLEAGTRLLGGRDSARQDIVFALPRDAAVNRARIAGLRSTYRTAGGEWLAAAVANSADGLGAALPKDDPRWPPFGREGLSPARQGWAVASPVMECTGGEKTIIAEFGLDPEAAERLQGRISAALASGRLKTIGLASDGGRWLPGTVDVAVTGPEGWHLFPGQPVLFYPSSRRVRIFSGAIDGESPVAGFDPAVHLRAYRTRRPVLEATAAAGSAAPDLFAGLGVESVSIRVSVTNDPGLVVANDFGPLDPAKPFEPFGSRPTARRGSSAGSRFLIGSREIFSKRLTALEFDVEWKDMPADLDEHYADYLFSILGLRPRFTAITATIGPAVTLGTIDPPSSFYVDFGYLDEGSWQPLGNDVHRIFESGRIVVPADALSGFAAKPDLPDFAGPETGLQRGFMRMELASPSIGFGHERYPYLVAREVARAIRAETDPAEIAAPITPVIARLAASYSAEDSLDATKGETGQLEYFHVGPHGEWAIAPGAELTLAPMLDRDAALHVGLADFSGGANVSLLFHLADGSGDPFVEFPEVSWSYLAEDRWIPFERPEILHDSTLSLRRTGIVTFAVPESATTDHTRMPAGAVWLRALARGHPAALNLAHQVYPQAAEAVCTPTPLNDPARLASPLPAGSIGKLQTARPAIKKVAQPLASFGGAVTESGLRFHRRAHERLRHRARAVELWDYERLVLQEFSGIYRAKCVTHSTRDSALAPGNVLVVVAPDTARTELLHPLRPAATQDVLAEVKDFLVARASGLATIDVVNPLYEELQVVARVRLRAGSDLGLFTVKLAAELREFIAPWLQGDPSALRFTHEIYPSQILNFIEERSYVDFVTDFTVRQWVDGAALSPDPAILSATTARSILTSHPEHSLTVEV